MPQTGATSAKSGSSSETLYWEFNNEDTSNPMATAVPVTFGSTSNSKTSFALSCTVCGVEFNSASQADAHYSGKKHKNAVAKSEELSSSTTTPTKSGPSTAIYQPYYWQFSGQGAFKDQYDENVYEDKPKDTDLICNVCQLSFNSPSQAEMHFNGKKHAAAVANKAITEGKASAINADSARQGGGKKGLTKFTCAVCDFSLNSQWQLNQHMNGIRHKLKAGIISEPPAWWSAQQEAVKNTKPGSGKGVYQFFKCEACDVTLNSQKQLEAHLTSQKHKQVAEGGGPPQRGRGRGRGMGRGADRRQRGGFQGGRGFNQRGGFRGRGASSRGGDGGRGSFQRGGIRGRGLNQRGGFGGRGGYQGRGGGVGSFQSGGGQYQDGGNSRGNSGRGNQRGARGGRGRGRGRGKAPKGPNPNKIPLYASFIPPKQFPKVQHGYGQGYYDG